MTSGEAVAALFATDSDNHPRAQLISAFQTVIERSTWSACSKVSNPITATDLTLIATKMAEFVMNPAADQFEAVIKLSNKNYLMGNEFEFFELAKRFSSDFLSESTFAECGSASLVERRIYADRLAAAILFRYRYCFECNEFFTANSIVIWLQKELAWNSDGRIFDRITALLRVFVSLEGIDRFAFSEDLTAQVQSTLNQHLGR